MQEVSSTREEQLAADTHHHLRNVQTAACGSRIAAQAGRLPFWASWRQQTPIDVKKLRESLRRMVRRMKKLIDAESVDSLTCGKLHVIYGHLLQAHYCVKQMRSKQITLSTMTRHLAGYPTPGETLHGN